MIEKIIMETNEGTKINLLELPQDTYGRLFGNLVKEGNNCVAMVVKAQMDLAKKRWNDKV